MLRIIYRKITFHTFRSRLLFVLKIIFKERQYSLLLKYLANGNPFPYLNYINKTSKMEIVSDRKFTIIKYAGDHIYYPKRINEKSAKISLNKILREQSNGSPHQYLNNLEVSDDWVIYDIGAAEGLQSKMWSKTAKQIIIFEPLEEWYQALLKTFENEIDDGKVKILKIGVSDEKRRIDFTNRSIFVDSLENIIKESKLMYPDYIKADVEGQELNFLKGAKAVLKKAKILEITVYHRPDDYVTIPDYLNHNFYGIGKFVSDRVMVWNGNGKYEKYGPNIYSPVIRRCLYRYNFTSERHEEYL